LNINSFCDVVEIFCEGFNMLVCAAQWVRSTMAKSKGLAERVKSVVQFRL